MNSINTFDEYRVLAMRTDDKTRTPEQRLHNAALGLLGEFGEVCDLFKKHLYHGHALDRDKLKKELGDVCWYLAAITTLQREQGVKREIIKVHSDLHGLLTPEINLFNMRRSIFNIIESIDNRDWPHISSYEYESLFQDIDWFADYYECSILDIWHDNIEKLQQRYPDGFSHEASVNRVV